MGDAARVIMVTPDELEALVHKAVRAALGQQPANDTDGLTTKQLAALLQIKTAKTIQKWCIRDGCPHTRLPNNEIRLKRDEVEAWLRERAVREGAHTTRHMEHARRLK